MNTSLKNELRNILSGKITDGNGALISSIASHLRNGIGSSEEDKKQKHFKKQEEAGLISFIESNRLWVHDIDFSQYVSEGAEQKVYLKDNKHVLKLNDSIYYNSWSDYFHNLILHNFFFPDTAYTLNGFTQIQATLFAVVQQNFVATDTITDLGKVKAFLESNGFMNNRNNDYINTELGIILEDLHDENVLTKKDILYFIDTVFYLTPTFWID
ncbi:MAG: hypothetical protein RL609_1343 [Bacteroidota bacterium]|jgi:hypothetical protein